MAKETKDTDAPSSSNEPVLYKLLWKLLIGAWAVTILAMVGGAIWLLFADLHDIAELRAHRSQVTLSLNAARTVPHGTASASPSLESPTQPAAPAAVDQVAPDRAAADGSTSRGGLHPHPDPMLVERGDLGMLPVIGKDGRQPWRVYARPFNPLDKRPQVAVVVMGLGVSDADTESALTNLPPAVSLSFAPFSGNLDQWIDRSRAGGHEVLIDLPMEPVGYPRNDPGPHTLLASTTPDQNIRQLEWLLTRASGYVGFAVFMGSALTSKPESLEPILAELKSRGLMLVDTRENPLGAAAKIAETVGLPVAAGDAVIDQELDAAQIDAQLAAIEARAKKMGRAVAIARPYPVTVRRLKSWIATLDSKDIVLTPVSAVAIAAP